MENTQIAGSTGENTEQSSAIKYKKALKQINKLININTSLKNQVANLQHQYDTLRKDYKYLLQKPHGCHSCRGPTNNNMSGGTSGSVSGGGILGGSGGKGRVGFLAGVGEEKENQGKCEGGDWRDVANVGSRADLKDLRKKFEQCQEQLKSKQNYIQELTDQLSIRSQEILHLHEQNNSLSSTLSQLVNERVQHSEQKKALETELEEYKELTKKLVRDLGVKGRSGNDGEEERGRVSFTPNKSKSQHNSKAKSKNKSQTNTYLQPHKKQQRQTLTPPSSLLQPQIPSLMPQTEALQKLKSEYCSRRQKYRQEIAALKCELSSREAYIKQISVFMDKQQLFIQSLYSRTEGANGTNEGHGGNIEGSGGGSGESNGGNWIFPSKFFPKMISSQFVYENGNPDIGQLRSYEPMKQYQGKNLQSNNSLSSLQIDQDNEQKHMLLITNSFGIEKSPKNKISNKN